MSQGAGGGSDGGTIRALDPRTDEQLLADYRSGDRPAMTILVRRYQPELIGFLTRLLGNRTAAEDVFQDTFLQVHSSAAGFDVSRRFKPWLFTIAANKGRDYYRKNGRRRGMVNLSAPARGGGGGGGGAAGGNGEAGASLVDFLAEETRPVDARLSEAELRDKVRQTIDAMPQHLKEILLLAYFQRLSYNDIADSLQIPLGTVKSRLHSAVAHFADRWRRTAGSEEMDVLR